MIAKSCKSLRKIKTSKFEIQILLRNNFVNPVKFVLIPTSENFVSSF